MKLQLQQKMSYQKGVGVPFVKCLYIHSNSSPNIYYNDHAVRTNLVTKITLMSYQSDVALCNIKIS